MKSEVVIWLVIIGVWLISNLIKFFRSQAAKSRQAAEQRPTRPAPQRSEALRPPPPPPPPAAPKPAVEDALSDLLKSFGVDIQPSSQERPVATEHALTPGEHARTASETRVTISEHDHSPGWHQRPASETAGTASEHSLSASFHRRSAGEHEAGDVFLPARPLQAVATAGRRTGSVIGRRVVADLHRDRDSLAEAVLLREVLGPPVSLRSPGERSFER
ncbi:MAG: hypothetical protein V3T72_16985 [Thermoanaerobaculia bacterium]